MSGLHSDVEPSWQWEANADHINDPLAVIYHYGQWTLNKVSPLNNLEYNRVRLKQYAFEVRRALVSSVSAKSTTKYAVQLDHLPLLKYCEDDADAIRIIVETSTGSEKSKSKIAYTGILLSWGVSCGQDDAIHLPYLLERGECKIADAVKACLQKLFDCYIKPFCFTQYQLLMFGLNFVETASSLSTDPFVLSYITPQMDIKHKLDFKFEVGDVHIMWNGFKDEANKMSELISLMYETFKIQIMGIIMTDISTLDICRITIPKAEVKSNGVVKMKSPEVVNAVFKVLNDIICTELQEEC